MNSWPLAPFKIYFSISVFDGMIWNREKLREIFPSSNTSLRIYNARFIKPAWKLSEIERPAWMLLAKIGSRSQHWDKTKINFVSYSFSWDELPKLVCCVVVTGSYFCYYGKESHTDCKEWYKDIGEPIQGYVLLPSSTHSHCKQHCSNFSQTALPPLGHSQAASGGRVLVFLHSVCPARNFLQNTSHFYFPLISFSHQVFFLAPWALWLSTFPSFLWWLWMGSRACS